MRIKQKTPSSSPSLDGFSTRITHLPTVIQIDARTGDKTVLIDPVIVEFAPPGVGFGGNGSVSVTAQDKRSAFAGARRALAKQALTLSLILVVIVTASGFSSCGTPKPNTPGNGFNAAGISSGAITSLTIAQSTLQSLVSSGKTQFQSELDAVNQVLAIAGPINADLQNGVFSGTTDQKITAFIALGSSLAIQFGADSNLVLAVNIAAGLYKSIRAALTGQTSGPAGAAAAPVDYKARQKALDNTIKAYKNELAARSK